LPSPRYKHQYPQAPSLLLRSRHPLFFPPNLASSPERRKVSPFFSPFSPLFPFHGFLLFLPLFFKQDGRDVVGGLACFSPSFSLVQSFFCEMRRFPFIRKVEKNLPQRVWAAFPPLPLPSYGTRALFPLPLPSKKAPSEVVMKKEPCDRIHFFCQKSRRHGSPPSFLFLSEEVST